MTVTSVLLIALALFAGLAVFMLWYRRDTESENRRRRLIDLAGRLTEARMPQLAAIVTDVSVHDWDGLARDVYALAKRAEEPGQLLIMLDANFFEWQLPVRLQDKAQLEKIRAAVNAVLAGVAATKM